MKPKILFILIFVQACGIEADTFDRADASSDLNTAKNAPGPCQGFIQSVFSFDPGDGAGIGQDRFPQIVLGAPQGRGEIQGSLDVLTLGDGGAIVVDTFPCEIVDGEGPDFIVFENAFYVGGNPQAPFAELGLVSVSADGTDFADFPCEEAAYPYTGCAGWHAVLSHPVNGISPFDPVAAGGDPFDLSDIGVEKARYIRIEDLWGIGVPPKVGFDLDAIAVINGLTQ